MRFPKISIIIPCYGRWMDTVECLESLLKIDYPDYEIILVDNSSPDDSVQKIREYCYGNIVPPSKRVTYTPQNKPISLTEYTRDESEQDSPAKDAEFNSSPINRRLKLIRNLENSGFAEGNNIGIRHALKTSSPGYLLLLNNDVIVDQGFLSGLFSVAEKDKMTGIIGPKIYFYDRFARHDIVHSAGGRIDLRKGTAPMIGMSEIDTGQFDSITEVDYVEGSCLLIKRGVVDEIGLLDARYHLYWEDTDYCIRAKTKGYRIIFSPSSKIWHKIGSTAASPMKLYYMTRNRFWFMKKNASKQQYRQFVLHTLPGICIIFAKKALTGKLNEAMATARASIDGLIGFPSEAPDGKIKVRDKEVTSFLSKKRAEENSIRVAIIILNYNRVDDTIECIDSLMLSTFKGIRIIVLDNGSKGDDVSRLEKKYGNQIDIIAEEKNLGVAAGWNLTIEYTKIKYNPDFIFLLNNDTIVDPSIIEEMLRFGDSESNAYAIGPSIVDFYSPGTFEPPYLKEIDRPIINHEISGAALLIRKEAFEIVGIFDEDFFVYGEESDFLYRMKKFGTYPFYYPTLGKVHHKGSATSSMISGFETYHRSRNSLVFIAKNLAGEELFLSLARYFLIQMPIGLLSDMKSRDRRNRIRGRIRGIVAGIVSYPEMHRKRRNRLVLQHRIS